MCLKSSRIKLLTKPLTVYKVILYVPFKGYCTPYTSVLLPFKLEGFKLEAKGPIILDEDSIGEGIIHAYTKPDSARSMMDTCFQIPYIMYEIWKCTINEGELAYIGKENTIGAKAITFNKRIYHV